MINKKLFDYVKRSLERGQSQKKITTSLIHKGWSRNLVESTIKQVLDGVELKYDLREVLKEGSRTTFEKDSFSVLGDAQKNNSSRSSGLLIIFISILIILLSSWWLSSSVVNIFNQEGFDFGKEMGELFDPTGYDREESLKIKAEQEEVAEIENLENKMVENIEKEDLLKDLIDEVDKLQEGLDLEEEETLENEEIDLDDIDKMSELELLEQLADENIGEEIIEIKYPIAQRYIYIESGDDCGWISFDRALMFARGSVCGQMGTVSYEQVICDQQIPAIYMEIKDGRNNNKTCQLDIFNETKTFQFYSLVNDYKQFIYLLEEQE